MRVHIRTSLLLAAAASGAFANTAGDVHFARTASGRLLIEGDSCSQVESEVRALSTWKIQIGESAGSPKKLLREGAGCRYDIQDSVPRFVAARTGDGTLFNGPNCFNTALMMSGVFEQSTYSQQPEVTFWLKSPFCRELSSTEKPAPGDLLQVRTIDEAGSVEEVHSFSYVSDSLVFSKNGKRRETSFTLSAPAEVFATYNVDKPECRRVRGVKNGCETWTNYFRCTPPKDDSLPTPEESKPQLLAARAAIRDTACELSEVAYGKKTLSPTALLGLEQSLLALRDQSNAAVLSIERTPPPRSPELQTEKFLWEAIAERSRSLRGQIYHIEGTRPGFSEND